MNIKKEAEGLNSYIIEQRRFLHAHPELSKKEFETTKHIAAELEKYGIEYKTWPDITGVVGVIKGKFPGKTVMLRADIDALPIDEPQNKEYASQNPGVMHACGHDCHTAMLLGAARLLSAHREELHGTVKLLFQMAEEVGRESGNYVKKGELDDVDALFGMHVWPLLESGTVNFEEGERMASSDRFTLTVKGVQAHGGSPHEGKDAVAAAAAVVMALQTIVSRLNRPTNSLVISVGMMHGGRRFNIIGDSTTLVGTVRTFNRSFRKEIPQIIEQTARNAAAIFGCSVECDYAFLPGPVINDHPELVATARGAVEKIMGEAALRPQPKVMGAEDFSVLMEKVPGVFGFLGLRNEEKNMTCSLHNSGFVADEAILQDGAALYAQFALDYLNSGLE